MDDWHPVKYNRYTKRWSRMPKIWQRLFWRHVERRVALFDGDGPVVAVEAPCPVCAYAMDEPPADFATCAQCGTEFGYHDVRMSHTALRQQWLDAGMPFRHPEAP